MREGILLMLKNKQMGVVMAEIIRNLRKRRFTVYAYHSVDMGGYKAHYIDNNKRAL